MIITPDSYYLITTKDCEFSQEIINKLNLSEVTILELTRDENGYLISDDEYIQSEIIEPLIECTPTLAHVDYICEDDGPILSGIWIGQKAASTQIELMSEVN